MQNVETRAHLAQIGRFGPEWFRQSGTPSEPGTVLLTIGGAVARPSIIEVPIGTPIDHILARAGGVLGSPEALLVGGFFGTWVRADLARRLEHWGFPIIDPAAVPPERLAEARWAADNCPALALRLGSS